MNTIILNQIILQCHCNHDLKNMHSMLFLKPPACSRKYPYSPPPGRDFLHATPPPLLLRLILLDVSGKLQSPHIPSSQTDKKNSPYPHPRRDVPHAPPPLPLWIFYNSFSTQTYPLMLSWQSLTTPKLKCLTHFLSCKLNMFVQRKDFCTCRKNLSYQKFFCLLGIIRARKQRKLWIKIDSTNNRCNHTLDFLYIVVQAK